MLRQILIALMMVYASSAFAQTGWLSVMPDTFHCHNLNQLYVDEAMDHLLAPGITSFAPNDIGFQVVPYYDGASWGYYGTFNYGSVRTTLRYGDTLLFAGEFLSVDTLPHATIVGRIGNSWIPFGQFADPNGTPSVFRLRLIDGELYAVGVFQYADGNECWGVAKREGGQWVNVGSRSYPASLSPIINDVCSYQGKLLIGGTISPVNGLAANLIQFNGNDWENVGNGLVGCPGTVSALEVYNGELYVGGGLMVGAGAVGHGLVRWNGIDWNDVGGDLHDLINSTNYNASANSFLLHDNKLYVGGSFSYAGGLEANRFAIWDGSSWCVTGDSVDFRVQTMAMYHDTLYVNCRDQLHLDTSNFVARWNGGPLMDTCAWAVGLTESFGTDKPFHVSQPSTDRLRCQGLPDGYYAMSVYASSGQLVMHQPMRVINGFGESGFIPTPMAIYLVSVTDGVHRWSDQLVTYR